jgi:hypothetical protein
MRLPATERQMFIARHMAPYALLFSNFLRSAVLNPAADDAAASNRASDVHC